MHEYILELERKCKLQELLIRTLRINEKHLREKLRHAEDCAAKQQASAARDLREIVCSLRW